MRKKSANYLLQLIQSNASIDPTRPSIEIRLMFFWVALGLARGHRRKFSLIRTRASVTIIVTTPMSFVHGHDHIRLTVHPPSAFKCLCLRPTCTKIVRFHGVCERNVRTEVHLGTHSVIWHISFPVNVRFRYCLQYNRGLYRHRTAASTTDFSRRTGAV